MWGGGGGAYGTAFYSNLKIKTNCKSIPVPGNTPALVLMTCQRKRKMQIEKKKQRKTNIRTFWLKCAEETPIVQPKVSEPPDNSKQDLLPFPSRTS